VDYPFSLRFGRNQLAIGQPFELRSNETAPRPGTPETRESIGDMLRLFGQVVARVAAFKNGSLVLDLADGRSLLVPPSDQYEAWNLGAGAHGLIVSTPGGGLSVWSGNR